MSPVAGRWARVALTFLLVPLGFHAFADQYGTVPILSDIDVAIHEFGHMLFMPFGDSHSWKDDDDPGRLPRFKVVFPLLFVGYFLYAKGQRDDARGHGVPLVGVHERAVRRHLCG